jgi:hypothetical protein
MLTPAQITKHWRDWSAVVRACHWRMAKGRLVPEAESRRNESIWQKLVWRTAEQLARQEHRSVTADDLRHACYIEATTKVAGWPRSAQPVASITDLGNRSFSRVLVLWALLIEPDDIAANIAWDHPEQAERQTIIASLSKSAPEATLRAIAGNAWNMRDWENLDIGQLRDLRAIVARWQKRYHKPIPVSAADEAVPTADDAVEQPF